MKRLLALGTTLLVASALAAEKSETSGKAPQKTETAAAADQQPVESPLVAAAKRTNRGASKTIVITDETVKKSTGRLTTTDSIYNPYLPPKVEPSAEVAANEQRAKAQVEEEKKSAEAKAAEAKRLQELARKTRLAEQAEEYEDGHDDDMDPAQLERELAAAAAKKKP